MRNAPRAALLTLTAATALAAFVTGCGNNSVATVDGVKISKQEYYDRLEQQPAGRDPQTQKSIEAGAVVLQQMVNEKLILRLAEKGKVSPTEAQVKERLDQLKKSTPNFSKRLEEIGITKDQLDREIRIQQAAFNLQTKGMKVADDKVKEHYDKNKDVEFTEPESANVAAIFVKDKADADKAIGLLKQSVTFDSVARTYSMDKVSAADGGILKSPIVKQAGPSQEPQDTIMQTKVGEITKAIPLPNGQGYAIFKILKHNDKRVKPLSEVEFSIREKLLTDLGSKKNPPIKEQLDKFRKETTVTVEIAKYKDFLNPKKSAGGLPGMEGTSPGQ